MKLNWMAQARCLLGRTHLLLGLSLRESIERGQVEAPDVKEVEAFIRYVAFCSH